MAPVKSSPLLGKIGLGEEIDWEPARLVTPGPWAGHIPFAHWLMKAATPKLLVELGTHTGNSFSAFCNAIARFDVPARAFAVDTWQGDEHAGHYGDEVYDELKTVIDKDYGGFATLVRSTFDGAISQFAPETVDVLHIDGMHTYDAVKHDFLTWYDMLSDRGIVLFHDTNVHEREFGVWKLWQELTERHPSFEFKHSNGLGVLGVGKNLPAPLKALFAAGKDEQATEEIRTLFAMRGRRFELATELTALQRDHARLNGNLDEARDYQRHLEETLEDLRSDKRLLDEAMTERNLTVSRLEATLTDTKRQRSDLAQAMEALHNSTSWRVTLPLRLASKVYNRYFRRYARALANRLGRGGGRAADGTGSDQQPALHNVALRDAVRTMMVSRLDAFLNAGSKLRLPTSAQPDVTIVLVLYNQVEMTYACLAAIKECLDDSAIKIETILFDNGSSDRTHALLDQIEGATIIRNDENLHFLRGVNAATQTATGRHILLLNNDAQITPGALEAAVKTLDDDATIGAVGARIILPDGRLQEAGSIIWSDGSCLGYGRGRKPDDAEFMFQRDVDYCSGAFLLTPRSLFERLGRLDEIYAPAYYEETDYCVRIWKENLRIVYNPKVTVHHFEFASSGKVADALALQERNLETFRTRHADWLAQQYAPDPAHILRARFHASTRPRVLFIEDRVPKQWLGAGFPRAADVVRELSEQGVQVTLFPTAGQPENWHDIWKAQPLDVEVVLPLVDDIDLRAFLQSRADYYDGLFVTRPHNMQRLAQVLDKEPGLRGKAKLIYDAEALFANREILKKELDGAPLSRKAQEKLIQDELQLTEGSDLVLSVSAAEQRIMQANGLQNVGVLGHQVHPDLTTAPFENRKDILFLGAVHGDDSPNADSIRWFADEILPELRRLLKRRDIRLQVVGMVQDAPLLQKMDGDSIDLRGRVDDLKSIFETARLVVVPTRYAAGIPHKVHHVASLGVPMVATDLIVEQLAWTAGRDILASSEAGQFAQHCHDLYADPDLWKSLRANALARVEEDCSPAVFRATIEQVVELVRNDHA